MVSVKRVSALILALLMLRSQAFAAFGAGMEWDVRTTGSDANGGGFDPLVASPGTDYSQQNAAQFAYTDIVIGGTTTQATSVARAFSAVDPGNVINVTAGAGCTVQRVEILSVAAGVATFDKSLGTAASTCTGNLGGSLLTIGAGATALGGGTASATVPGILHIKSGTYTLTSGVTFSSLGGQNLVVWGYETTHRDGGTRPLITTATNSVNLFTSSSTNTKVYRNLSLSNTAGTRGVGIVGGTGGVYPITIVEDSILDGFSYHYQADAPGTAGHFTCLNSELKNATTGGVVFWFEGSVDGCYFHDNVGDALKDITTQNYYLLVRNSIFDTNGRGVVFIADELIGEISGNTFYNQTTDAVYFPASGSNSVWLQNNVFYGNGGYAVNCNGTGTCPSFTVKRSNRNNAYGSNVSGTQPVAGLHDVTLSANPFTDAPNGDFTLNNTAGGGASLKGAAFPSGFGTTTANSLDIGAVQSPVPSCSKTVCGGAH